VTVSIPDILADLPDTLPCVRLVAMRLRTVPATLGNSFFDTIPPDEFLLTTITLAPIIGGISSMSSITKYRQSEVFFRRMILA
jgi:hypothetical protein